MDVYYTGIGSRKDVPSNVMEAIGKLAYIFAKKGFILRSGTAEGCDAKFEEFCDKASGKKEIYLPWKGFNQSQSDLYTICHLAEEIAFKYHPNFYALSDGAQKLMSRNSYQVLGKDLKTPSTFVVCYCPIDSNGNPTGGTSQALRIAKDKKIPTFNLGVEGDLIKLKEWVAQLEEKTQSL
jgi:hypothetical protein